MKTIITGANGHIGANLTRALIAKGREVRIFCTGIDKLWKVWMLIGWKGTLVTLTPFLKPWKEWRSFIIWRDIFSANE